MKIGMMNNPRFNLLEEISWAGKNGFNFLDLTLEPPAAHPLKLSKAEVRKSLAESGLEIIGHTAYYLPLASPYERLRLAAIEELRLAMQFLADLGAETVTIHPDKSISSAHHAQGIFQKNLSTLEEVINIGQTLGIKILLENMDRVFNTVEQIQEALARFPQLGFHLDVGHANLFVEKNRTEEFLKAFYGRLEHVHFSDNFGKSDDLHLPLGAGNIEWAEIVSLLKGFGYDGTITLEVFSSDRRYLLQSREYLLELWSKC